jgi:hypothetical protein
VLIDRMTASERAHHFSARVDADGMVENVLTYSASHPNDPVGRTNTKKDQGPPSAGRFTQPKTATGGGVLCSPEVLKRRKETGVCFNCGKAGCFSHGCPNPSHPTRVEQRADGGRRPRDDTGAPALIPDPDADGDHAAAITRVFLTHDEAIAEAVAELAVAQADVDRATTRRNKRQTNVRICMY